MRLFSSLKPNNMYKVAEEISKAVLRAKEKHPQFAANEDRSLILLMEEVGEAAQALNDDDKANARAEILDAIAVCVRYLETF